MNNQIMEAIIKVLCDAGAITDDFKRGVETGLKIACIMSELDK